MATSATQAEAIKTQGKLATTNSLTLFIGLNEPQGNLAFKEGRYDDAIAAYTKCIELSPENATFYNNRAMAQLKVNAFRQAELDCTSSLQYAPDNVKALWRRGTSRKFQQQFDQARDDLKRALTIEPQNKAVQQELALVESYLAPAPAAKGRNIPVEVISTEHAFQELQNHIAQTTSAQPVPPTNNQQPSTTLTSILKNQPTETETTSEVRSTRLPVVEDPIAPPTNMLDFQRRWRTYRRDPVQLARFLKAVKPDQLKSLFQSTFDADYMADILRVLQSNFVSAEGPRVVYDILRGVTQIPRFTMVQMFMDRQEQSTLASIFHRCLSDPRTDAALKAEFAQLQSTYGC
ncbi:hypothetical protein H4R33_003483 [Dimargaris cristalligena]|uniref:RNA polymerase II-associated protein 3 n=1 Tax=Dimargaris cristalligena TaxID=215637 RepID=A0A4Q0A0I8_9FUNG|nr:hypothetical protein H4R33_003483 [Dimargaris cristalligena]RKP38941.1 hypothetical protein BJ085DRAFT_30789 [Dimargaris cristalligena]|eukprot:RKP38941.1 hypothetical protein BJ085DRAFT_30789 [Dimargaris cristalligena]